MKSWLGVESSLKRILICLGTMKKMLRRILPPTGMSHSLSSHWVCLINFVANVCETTLFFTDPYLYADLQVVICRQTMHMMTLLGMYILQFLSIRCHCRIVLLYVLHTRFYVSLNCIILIFQLLVSLLKCTYLYSNVCFVVENCPMLVSLLKIVIFNHVFLSFGLYRKIIFAFLILESLNLFQILLQQQFGLLLRSFVRVVWLCCIR